MWHQNSIMNKIPITEILSNRSLHQHDRNPNPIHDTMLRETCLFSSLSTLMWGFWLSVCRCVFVPFTCRKSCFCDGLHNITSNWLMRNKVVILQSSIMAVDGCFFLFNGSTQAYRGTLSWADRFSPIFDLIQSRLTDFRIELKWSSSTAGREHSPNASLITCYPDNWMHFWHDRNFGRLIFLRLGLFYVRHCQETIQWAVNPDAGIERISSDYLSKLTARSPKLYKYRILTLPLTELLHS